MIMTEAIYRADDGPQEREADVGRWTASRASLRDPGASEVVEEFRATHRGAVKRGNQLTEQATAARDAAARAAGQPVPEGRVRVYVERRG
jgi:hypothetical protein